MASSGWLPGKRQVLCGVSPVPRAWVKPGEGGAAEVAQSEFRAKRTEVREPQTRRTDAFPRNGAAGPGCQAATVADGRRKPETDAPRWRKCASWMQGGPTDGERKPATERVAGWRPDEGREGKFITTRVFHSSIKYPSNMR